MTLVNEFANRKCVVTMYVRTCSHIVRVCVCVCEMHAHKAHSPPQLCAKHHSACGQFRKMQVLICDQSLASLPNQPPNSSSGLFRVVVSNFVSEFGPFTQIARLKPCPSIYISPSPSHALDLGATDFLQFSKVAYHAYLVDFSSSAEAC